MKTRELNRYIKSVALNKEKQTVTPDKCAELAIECFCKDNFAFGKYTFKSFLWIDKYTVKITDRNEETATIHYDVTLDKVTLV